MFLISLNYLRFRRKQFFSYSVTQLKLNYVLHHRALCALWKKKTSAVLKFLVFGFQKHSPFSYQVSLQMKSPRLDHSKRIFTTCDHPSLSLTRLLWSMSFRMSDLLRRAIVLSVCRCRVAPSLCGAVATSAAAVAPQQSLCLVSKQQRSNGGAGQPGQRHGGRGRARALLRKAGILPAGRWSQCIPPKQLPIGS